MEDFFQSLDKHFVTLVELGVLLMFGIAHLIRVWNGDGDK